MQVKYVLSLFAVGIFVATNPSQDVYLDYAVAKTLDEVKSNLCINSGSIQDQNLVLDIFNGICKNGVNTAKNQARDFIRSNTIRQNFIFFSIYTTEIVNQNYKTLGVLGNFLVFSKG